MATAILPQKQLKSHLLKKHGLEIRWKRMGKKVPKEIAMRMRFKFSGDKLFIRGNFDDDREVECSFRLDEKQEPNHIDFATPTGNKPILGIYQCDGDSLKICMRHGNSDKGRPTKFKTTSGSELILITFALDDSDKNSANSNSGEETPMEKWVVGTYEVDEYRLTINGNGTSAAYFLGKKVDESRWKTVDGEIHFINEGGVSIVRVNRDGSLTEIANIPKGGKRISTPKTSQLTFKKIK